MTLAHSPAGAEPLTLYGFWRSQATFRLRVALHMKGIPFREHPVNLDKGEQNDPQFREISALGSVPALIVEGVALTQSLAVLDYVEETHPTPPLLPSDALGRWRVRSLAGIAVSDSHPLIVPRVRRYLAEHAGFDATAWKAWQSHWFSAALRGFEARLNSDRETGAFCHGDQVSIADICLAGLMAGADAFSIKVTDIPTVDRIVTACRKLPSFVAARAENQADFPG